jgi:SAM-dependent methyltransferase
MNKKTITDKSYGYKRLDPIPSQNEVEKFYATEFYESNNKYFNNSSLLVQEEQSDFFNMRWEKIKENIVNFYSLPESKKIFDIGFGFAQALRYFDKLGFEVSGIEPSTEGYEYAKSKGLEVYHSGIEDFDCIRGKHFDIVLLLNVLEHLREPEVILKNIKDQVLNPDGLLVIDVPNDFNIFQEIANKEYGLNEWWVVAPNHINYFSHESLSRLLEGCGYKIVNCTSTFPIDLFLLFGDNYIGDLQKGKTCHNKRVNFEKLMVKYGKQNELEELYKSFARMNIGRGISIYATPIN